MKTKKSWDSLKNLDCFENGNPKTIDHIWPKSKGGSNGKINQMHISLVTNQLMGDKTKGRIGQYRWSKVKAVTKDKTVYGILRIRHDSEQEKTKWITITPIL